MARAHAGGGIHGFAYVVEPDLIHVTLSGVLSEEDLRSLSAAAAEIEATMSPVPPRITIEIFTGAAEALA